MDQARLIDMAQQQIRNAESHLARGVLDWAAAFLKDAARLLEQAKVTA